MRFGSLFSGIGGIDLGLERAGMECAWQVEIDEYRRQVLARHWPNVRRYEDVRRVCVSREHRRGDLRIPDGSSNKELAEGLTPVDLICGGFPCQDVSTAGKRAGLQAPRSGLFFEFARIVGELRPKWIVVENVPGLYSSNAGKDFDTIIGTLAELNYGLAARVLDSQYFGVPQRRRRVFIVGYLGNPCPPAVLFEREGGEGDSQEGGKKGEGIAFSLAASARGTGDGHGNWWNSTYIPEISPACERHWAKHGNPEGGHSPLIAVSENQRAETRLTPYSRQLTMGGGKPGQGYPAVLSSPPNADGMRETTSIPRRLDSRRYAALGDAVTVNVAEWIGKRIMAVEGIDG